MSFFAAIESHSQNTALLLDNKKTILYKDLIHSADTLATHVPKRSLVFVLCQNSVEFITAYLGFLRSQTVMMLLSDTISQDHLNKLYKTYQPSHIFCPKQKSRWNFLVTKVTSFGDYDLLKTGCKQSAVPHQDLALLMSTSGSTGSPKFVRLSYKNLSSNAHAIAQYLNISQSDRPITTMPPNYTYGLSIINSHLAKGAAIILNQHRLTDKRFWEKLKHLKATTFGGVPTMYEMLQKLDFNQMDLPHLRYITQAGGHLSENLVKEFAQESHQKNRRFIVMYGQTEATARIAYLSWDDVLQKPGSIGRAIPQGKLELIKGELVYSGDNVCMGYAKEARDLAKADENQGVLHTGDLATQDEDGFYYITGRKKRFVKVFGHRIHLNDIESLLKQQGYQCACTGNDKYIHVFIKDCKDSKKAENLLSKQTGIHPSAFKVIILDEIPHNPSGKIDYNKLKTHHV